MPVLNKCGLSESSFIAEERKEAGCRIDERIWAVLRKSDVGTFGELLTEAVAEPDCESHWQLHPAIALKRLFCFA